MVNAAEAVLALKDFYIAKNFCIAKDFYKAYWRDRFRRIIQQAAEHSGSMP
jgi:hypothetical protein